MFDLPAVGDGCWHDHEPLIVRAVEDGFPAIVHLEQDSERAADVRARLPDGYWISGGRSNQDGRWHLFLLSKGVDHPVGAFLSQSLERALEDAITTANDR
jgi:hypothetical protein